MYLEPHLYLVRSDLVAGVNQIVYLYLGLFAENHTTNDCEPGKTTILLSKPILS
jgi:hypothetical protein